MRIIDRGIVFTGEKDTDHQSCAFPGICILPGGRWICSFRAAPRKIPLKGQHVLVTWSDDCGKTWTKPILPFSPIEHDGRQGLIRGAYMTPLGGMKVLAVLCWVDNSDPELPFFNEETEGLIDTKVFLSWSEDGGESWSEPKIVYTFPFHDVPTAITGPVLLMPDGTLACQFELNKTYYDTSEWRHSSVMIFSSDRGMTWQRYTKASGDPENRIFYWDQRPSVFADGRLLDLFWTFDRKSALYLNIHARESMDCGRTWSEIWDTGVPGQPAQPVMMPDGSLAMVYVDRTGAPAVKLRISHDGGHIWPADTEMLIYSPSLDSQTWNKSSMQDAWAEMGRFSVGLPATAGLSNGELVVVYYAGEHMDLTDIHWVRAGNAL